MGVELNITRAEFFVDNENAPIAAEEWLAYVHGDPEMALISANGPYHAVWLGKSLHEEPWLDWRHGNIYTKWPDTALYLKMLDIAKHFGGSVQDDNGTVYMQPTDWKYAPNTRVVLPITKRPWWKLW